MSEFTHFDQQGQAWMVNVGGKMPTKRVAIATGFIQMQANTRQLIQSGHHKKGDVLGIARIAAIMASKKTSDLIPLCHPIPLTHVTCEFSINEEKNQIHCQVKTETIGQTGVEIEAINAVQIALLTIYDMCKAVDRGMEINAVKLLKKTGGASGDWESSEA